MGDASGCVKHICNSPLMWPSSQGSSKPPYRLTDSAYSWPVSPRVPWKQKGTRDFFECCRDPEVASTITLQPIERFAGLIDAAIIFSDILVIPQAMGMVVEMVDKKGPHFPNPLKSPDDGQYQEVMQREVDVSKELDYV